MCLSNNTLPIATKLALLSLLPLFSTYLGQRMSFPFATTALLSLPSSSIGGRTASAVSLRYSVALSCAESFICVEQFRDVRDSLMLQESLDIISVIQTRTRYDIVLFT